MTVLQEIETKLSQLSRAEKAQVLKWVTTDLDGAFSGIEKISGVVGGDACIVRTRIPVWTLVQAKRLGASEYEGIIVSKFDRDYQGLAERIHAALQISLPKNQLIRVHRSA
jgi:uncharacterized protein (DUF433 family)